MTRQELFEAHWADVHAVPVETMAQYRFVEKEGYRLPGIAAGYRNFCAGWDACQEANDRYRQELLQHLSDFEQEATV